MATKGGGYVVVYKTRFFNSGQSLIYSDGKDLLSAKVRELWHNIPE